MGNERPVFWGNLAGVGSNLLWATSIPATEILLSTWPPIMLATGRLVTAALGILLLFPILRRRLVFHGLPWPRIARLAGLYMVPSVVLMVWGQALSDPITAAIIITTSPLVSAMIGRIQGTERLPPSLLGGVALAIGGGILASGSFQEGTPGFRGGELVVLASITLWAMFSRATVRDLGGHDSLVQSLVTVGTAGAMLTLLSSVLVGTDAMSGIDPAGWEILLLLWMGGVGIGMSMPLWFISVRLLGITVASMHQNLLPFYVLVLAVLLGQGEIGPHTLGGAVLVSLGALVAQIPWGRLRRRRLPDPLPALAAPPDGQQIG